MPLMFENPDEIVVLSKPKEKKPSGSLRFENPDEIVIAPKPATAAIPSATFEYPNVEIHPAIPMKLPDRSRIPVMEGIAMVETKDGKGYDALNPKSSATGKHQFLWDTWGSKVSDWAGRPVSQEEFLRTPNLQEDYAKHYYQTVLIPEGNKLLKEKREQLNRRNVSSVEDAQALIHFLGANNARRWAETGVLPKWAQENNITVEDYLKRFNAARTRNTGTVAKANVN